MKERRTSSLESRGLLLIQNLFESKKRNFGEKE